MIPSSHAHQNARAAVGGEPDQVGEKPRTASPVVRIIHIKEVKYLTSLCTTSIYEMMAAGTFPRSVRLGARRVGWLQAEVEAWIQARVSESSVGATLGATRQ